MKNTKQRLEKSPDDWKCKKSTEKYPDNNIYPELNTDQIQSILDYSIKHRISFNEAANELIHNRAKLPCATNAHKYADPPVLKPYQATAQALEKHVDEVLDLLHDSQITKAMSALYKIKGALQDMGRGE